MPSSDNRIALQSDHQHLPVLDGVRGLAILLVVVHHLVNSSAAEFGLRGPLVKLLNAGWIGVDLFFVLSGFLITGILLRARGSKHYFRNFYARRSLRIFPLYYGTLTAALLLGALVPAARVIVGNADYTFGLWFYLTNVFLALHGWETFGWLAHFWSLAIEEHFYLVWPFLVFICSRRALLMTLGVIVLGTPLLRLGAHAAGVWPDAIYFLTPFRADSLAMGALLAVVASQAGSLQRLRPYAWAAAGISLAALAVIAVRYGDFDYRRGLIVVFGFSFLATAGASLIVMSLTSPERGLLSRTFSHPVMTFFGRYSYGLYVLHVPIFTALFHTAPGRELLGRFGLWSVLGASVVATTVSIGAALVSWYLWEAPFLRLKRYFSHAPSARRERQTEPVPQPEPAEEPVPGRAAVRPVPAIAPTLGSGPAD